ncbi:hypothetical protein HD554DRAFT_2168262 [Boletus coccyginus]|nr:hypothetical protein HD554DRAFT_2168262 [Boletus coccyginus]
MSSSIATSSVLDIFHDISACKQEPAPLDDIDKVPKSESLRLMSAAKAKAEVLASFGSKKLADYSKLVKQSTIAPTSGFQKIHGYLQNAKAPSGRTYASDMQAMCNQECFITADSDKCIAIDSAWMHLDVTAQLHAWFPQVFQQTGISKNKKNSKRSKLKEDQLDWRLLTYHGAVFMIVDMKTSNGSTLHENKGWGKSGISKSQL